MAQFGLHALIGLWIAWSLPLFSPYVVRVSFGAGIYLGCVFPDIDIYAAAIAGFVHPDSTMEFHRTLTHSVITAFALLLIFSLIGAITNNRKKDEHNLYEIEASSLDDDALLALSGALSSQERHFGIDFRVFGLGLFAGMCIHILLDVVFWFAPINLLFPLPNFGIGKVVDAWDYTPPYIATVILTLSELLLFVIFFVILRVSAKRRLGKWVEAPEELASSRKRMFTDNDIEHASMDFSLHAQEDICPIDQKTLSRARPALFALKILIIFQSLYFVAACMTPFINKDILWYVVFAELMVVCIPAYVYLSMMLRDVILRKAT